MMTIRYGYKRAWHSAIDGTCDTADAAFAAAKRISIVESDEVVVYRLGASGARECLGVYARGEFRKAPPGTDYRDL